MSQSDRIVNIKGEGHSSVLAAFLTESWAGETFANVRLYCEEPSPPSRFGILRAVNANCSVLAAGSPIFHHYLRHIGTDSEDSVIILLPEYSYKVIKEMVCYFYTGTLPRKITSEFQQTLSHFGVSLAQPQPAAVEPPERTTEKHIRIRVLPSVTQSGKQANLKGNQHFKVRSRIIRELPQSQVPVLLKRQPAETIDAPGMSKKNVTLSILPEVNSIACSPEKGLHGDQYCPRSAGENSNGVAGKSPYLGTLVDIGIYNNPCRNISKISVSQNTSAQSKLTITDESSTLCPNVSPLKRYSKGSLGTKRDVRLPCLNDTSSVQVLSLSRHGNKIHVTVKGPSVSSSSSSTLFKDFSKKEENRSLDGDSPGDSGEVAVMFEAYTEEKKRREKFRNKLRSLRTAVEQAKLLARKLLAKNGASLDLVTKNGATLTDMIRKTPAPKLPCRICKKLVSKSYMWSHLQIHSETSYLCEQCGRIFTLKSGLQMHQKYQHGEEPSPSLACSVCGKKFAKAHNLKMHMTLHDGLKPHSCQVCGKKFRLAHSLKKHTRIHTGERPYECQACGKAFRTRSSYKTHVTKHSICSEAAGADRNAPEQQRREIPQVPDAERAIEFSHEEAAASILLILPAANCN